jgi:hypothetical protein
MNIFQISNQFHVGDNATSVGIGNISFTGKIIAIDHDVENGMTWFSIESDGEHSSGVISHRVSEDSNIFRN